MMAGERNEKINLTGVPETMLQTIYARAKESKGRGAIHDKKVEEIIEKSITIFRLRTRILPCTAVSLPALSCWTG